MDLHFPQFLHQFDYNVVNSATTFIYNNPGFQLPVYFIAELLIFAFPVVLYYLWRRPELSGGHHTTKKAVIMALVSLTVALAVKTVISFFLFRARPFVSHPDLLAMTFRVSQDSFPSSHTMIAFVLASSLWFSGYLRLGRFLLFAAVLVALGRVFSGVHYPTDVLMGALIGIFSAWYIHREASSLKRYLPNT